MRRLSKLAKRSRGHEAAGPAGSSPWLGLVPVNLVMVGQGGG